MTPIAIACRAFIGTLMILTAAAAWCADWQHSVGVEVEIGIRSPSSPGYQATFTVRSPDGRRHLKSIEVAGDAFGYVRFPWDFATDFPPGVYRWSVTVEGREVTRGRFVRRMSASGQASVRVD